MTSQMQINDSLMRSSGNAKKNVARVLMGLAVGSLLWANVSEATCHLGEDWVDRGAPGYTSGMGIAAINVMSNYLQPMGSVIAASTVVPYQSFAGAQAGNPNDVLYYCDTQEDADNFMTLIANNGDFAGGGMQEVPGYPGAYYTGWRHVAFRITAVDSGHLAEKHYQQVPLTPIYNPDKNRYEVLFKQLSPLRLELIKVPTEPPIGITAVNDNDPYPWSEPFVYYVFTAPGINPYGPLPGEDSQYEYTGWSADFIGFGIYRNPKAIMYRRAGCVVRNNTPYVLFPTMSILELNQGGFVQSPVQIEVECDSDITRYSGTGAGQTAFGLQVSPETYSVAQSLTGLVNSYGGVSYLLSDGYGSDPTVATGVGIRLEHATTGEQMQFLGWHGYNCTYADPEVCGENPTGGGKAAGWYPILEGAQETMITEFQTTKYSHNLIAILEKLPNETVTTGKIKARAQVLVRVQ